MADRFLFTVLLLIFSEVLAAQTEDFGVWTSAGIEKELKKLSIGAEAELRTTDFLGGIDRWSLRTEAGYDIVKPLKAGVAYQFIYFNDTEYSDFQPRHRFYLFLQWKQELGRFTLALRERLQRTTKDESGRIKENGKTDTYRINPDICWRNRFKLAYDIPRFPINPSLSVETFYQLNNPDGNGFEQFRYSLAFSCKIKKDHELEVYGLLDQGVYSEDPVSEYVGGLSYTFSF